MPLLADAMLLSVDAMLLSVDAMLLSVDAMLLLADAMLLSVDAMLLSVDAMQCYCNNLGARAIKPNGKWNFKTCVYTVTFIRRGLG
jgi:hypothetical protein